MTHFLSVVSVLYIASFTPQGTLVANSVLAIVNAKSALQFSFGLH